MAANEGLGQELLTGWSCVVHQPSDDPEPSELPSTVDMAAFTSGLSVDPPTAEENKSSDSESDTDSDSNNSGSDGSGSGSQSGSSDSESSSTSPGSSSRSPSPEFSVTTSQTNSLRLTIATVRKSCASPLDKTKTESKDTAASNLLKSAACSNLSSSSESVHSKSHSESDSDSDSEKSEHTHTAKSTNNVNNKSDKEQLKKSNVKARKPPDKKEKKVASTRRENNSPKDAGNKVKVLRQRRQRKMASLPLSRGSTCSSSETDESDADSAMLASCSLQEIPQEDLAAILPDQQDDAFADFETRPDKTSPQTDDASGSDMELPQQAVNALIQRTTESSSENESHAPVNPNSLFANCLLQQFAQQTQMLNAPASGSNLQSSDVEDPANKKDQKLKTVDIVKRKRGRPRKVDKLTKKPLINLKNQSTKSDYVGDPNVSPDSGIQNSPDRVGSSPEGSPIPRDKTIKHKLSVENVNEEKCKMSSKKNGTKTNLHSTTNCKTSSITSNRYDRVLYGTTERVLYPPRRKGRPVSIKKGPGRPPKIKPTHHNSHTSTHDRLSHHTKNNIIQTDQVKSIKGKKSKTKDQNVGISLRKNDKSHNKNENDSSKKTSSKSSLLFEICERVSKRLELNNKFSQKNEGKTKPKTHTHNTRVVLASKNKLTKNKPTFTTTTSLKNAKLMHSKHKHKKHKKCKFKYFTPISINPDPKINMEIDKLVHDFMKLCNISGNKPAKENVPENLKSKKSIKKRKASEVSEIKKKKEKSNGNTLNETSSSNEQRLPLKKRHYHLSPSDDKNSVFDYSPTKSECELETKADVKIKAREAKTALISSKSDKPKVNHKSAIHNSSSASSPSVKYESLKSPSHNSLNSSKVSGINNNNEYLIKSSPKSLSEDSSIIETSKSDENLNKRKKEKFDEQNGRSSVIKYPPTKKSKSDSLNNTSIAAGTTIVAAAAATAANGVFAPSFDMELQLPNEVIKKEVKEELISPKEATVKPLSQNQELKKDGSVVIKKKVRKRRAPNRTGFPTIKKKKKRIVPEVLNVDKEEEEEKQQVEDKDVNKVCDRVPQDGEDSTTFLQRMEKSSSNSSLPKFQQLDIQIPEISKWEVMSECDSLPQEDRIDFDSKSFESSQRKSRDVSPSTSIETQESSKTSEREDIDDVEAARLKRIRLLKKKNLLKHTSLSSSHGLRQRLNKRSIRKCRRDISPCSSTEQDKRGRDDVNSGDDKKTKKQPRWRKKYLVAGLFSDYYKDHDEASRQRRNENLSKSRNIVYNPEEHPFGLLPAPYHCGKYLRCRKLPFQLPYDLWWMHTHSQLPGRDIVPSWNYRKIRTNVYNVKITTGACEPQACNCSPTSNCGDDCINRLVLAECPASHKCQNQKIQRHEWAPGIEKFMTDEKGWGIRTNMPIKNGEFILEYVGEVVSDQEFKERMATRYVHDTHHYCLHLDGGLVIDGHRMGGDGRFVNHSCQPNCEMQKWSVNGQFRMALFALREIKAGEELTYDYNFSLFNAAEGQECKCGSENCRGVIGGKSQRVRPSTAPPNTSQPGRVGRPRKNAAAKKQSSSNTSKSKEPIAVNVTQPVVQIPAIKPLTNAQKAYVLEHHCFLIRNLNKVKRLREKCTAAVIPPAAQTQSQIQTAQTNQNSAFLNHLNALRQPRNMKTRRLAQVEENPELTKTAKLANILRDLYNVVIEMKDENDKQLSSFLLNLPSKKKCPEYYQKISDPIDLVTIEQNLTTGFYKSAEMFDADISRVLNNAIKFYRRTSDLGIAAARLKKAYNEAKLKFLPKFEDELGVKLTAFMPKKNKNEEEDVIRCICGMYRDEGLMIQCERCLVWQHCECVHADPAAASYHCEKCVHREVDYEIPLDEYTEHGHRYYMTLLRGTLQLRQGDTVYVLRDIPIPGTDKKHTYETIGEIKYTDLDIFRIERLWKDSKTGQRFAYGHHYLRPHETYHEPTRRFFPNEVMRVPLYEAVPVELIIEHCWVLDLNTYCKGRPIDAAEEHVYICEFRVDKTARLFSKVAKSKFPICTKSYAFDRFDQRIKVYRTYTPHDLDPELNVKPRGRKPIEEQQQNNRETPVQAVPQLPLPSIPVIRTPAQRKTRLNKILLNLLNKMPTKQVVDISYLLEGGRRRKKNT